jgi:periplasmic protein TonB
MTGLIKASDRIKAGAITFILQMLFGYVLISAFGIRLVPVIDDSLKVFDLAVPPPLPPPEKPKRSRIPSPKREGAASPPNLRAKPTEIMAPKPVIPLIIPPPVIVAPMPAMGSRNSAGAAERPGPGTGSGGQGRGTGSGDSGDGEGSGGGEPLRWLRGKLHDSDYPNALSDAGIGGMVSVQFRVEPDGRVSDCSVTRSSGNRELDAMTCRLIQTRYRFRAPRDASGRPLSATVIEDHEWIPHPRRDEQHGD